MSLPRDSIHIAAGVDQLILELKQAFHMTIIVVTPLSLPAPS